MSRRALLLGVAALCAAFLGICVTARNSRPKLDSHARPARKPAPAPEPPRPAALVPERRSTPHESARAIESAQVRTLVQRLRESVVQGDEITRDAMATGLKKWKGARSILEEELARSGDVRQAEALRKVLSDLE